ncbi:MAG: NUDIX hydrolase [Chlorobium sp.]|jgi:8-oxo-dGTP diphosphatase
MMRYAGTSIIFFSSSGDVLLVLRDDVPTIACPNMWDLPGGHIEIGETPAECIVREMLEEIEVNVEGCELFRVYEFSDHTEYVFKKAAEFDLDNIVLHEGQMLRWFSETEILRTELAYGFNEVLADYFKSLQEPH